jgi:hypothetical protein
MTRSIEVREFFNHRKKPLNVQDINDEGPVTDADGNAVLVVATTALVAQHVFFKMPPGTMQRNDPRRFTQLMNKLDADLNGAKTIELHDKTYEWLQNLLVRDLPVMAKAATPSTVVLHAFGVDAAAVVWQFQDPDNRKTFEESLAEGDD